MNLFTETAKDISIFDQTWQVDTSWQPVHLRSLWRSKVKVTALQNVKFQHRALWRSSLRFVGNTSLDVCLRTVSEARFQQVSAWFSSLRVPVQFQMCRYTVWQTRPFHFYRAMLCVARTMLSPDVSPSIRLSVCPSHVSILSKRLNRSSDFFTTEQPHRSSSFYKTKHYDNIPTGTPLMGASTARGYEKIAIFDKYLAISQKQYNVWPQLLWNANRKPYSSLQMVPFSMTLSDLVTYLMT